MVLSYINLYAVNCNEQRRIIGLMKGRVQIVLLGTS